MYSVISSSDYEFSSLDVSSFVLNANDSGTALLDVVLSGIH